MTSPAIAVPSPRPRVTGNLFAAASMVVWAAGFPAADLLLDTWDPFAAAAGRFVMAMALLGPLWLMLEGVPRGVPWARGLLTGAVGIGGGAVLLILAQAATDPVTVAVFASASPLTATLVEWATDRRPLTRSFGLGLAASVLGGVVATWGGGGGEGNLPLGAGLCVLSCLVYSWGSQASVRLMPRHSALAQTSVSVTGALMGALLVLAVALALGRDALPESVGGRDLGLLAVYGLGGMAASQLLFILAVRRIGVALSSFHINVAPFYVMLMLVALGGDWSWAQALGALIVGGGVILAQR